MEIYLARHGQNEDNLNGLINGHRDLPLTDVGLAQARELGELANLQGLNFDAVYTSPLVRASITAEIVASVTASPLPVVLPELIERDFGILTGRPFGDIRKYATELLETDHILYFLEAEGAETFPDVLKRAYSVLKMMAEAREANGEKVLIVCHDGIGKMLYSAFHGVPWRRTLKEFKMGNTELIWLHRDRSGNPHVIEIDQRGLTEKNGLIKISKLNRY